MNSCPVVSFERAGDGYAEKVAEWIANPHAYFKSFRPEARTFQKKHPSERLRTMTLVAPAAELAVLRPVRLSLDGRDTANKKLISPLNLLVEMSFCAWLGWLDSNQRPID